MKLSIGYVSKNESLPAVRASLEEATVIGIDTETTGLDAISKNIRLLQLATDRQAWVLDLFSLDKYEVGELLRWLLPHTEKVKVFHNAKFDLKFIQSTFGFGLREITNLFDTYIAYRLIDGGQMNSGKLGDVVQKILGFELEKEHQKDNWAQALTKEQVTYAGLDAGVLMPLHRELSWSLYNNQLIKTAVLEFNCIPAIAQLELNGILLDTDHWIKISDAASKTKRELETAIWKEVGNIDLASTAKLRTKLSGVLGIPLKSVKESVLRELRDNAASYTDMFGKEVSYKSLLTNIMLWRKEAKRVSAFGPAFIKFVHPITGRLHPDYRQIDTNTARFSCATPNLQQIPHDSEQRSCFIPADGYKFVCYDYSQIELRILAYFTGDEIFMQAFKSGLDLHSAVAAQQLNIPIEKVSPEQRSFIKAVSFGIPYGQGAPGLSEKLQISVTEAKKRLEDYYKAHPWIVKWHESQLQYYKQYDCVRTVTGRLRALPNWRYSDEEQHRANQAAKNFPIQSTSADILKTAITNIFRNLPDARLVNQVHDELIFEVPESEAELFSEQIREEMVKAAELLIPGVPVEVNGGIYDCWQKG